METLETGPVLAIQKSDHGEISAEYILEKEEVVGDEATMEITVRKALEEADLPKFVAGHLAARLKIEEGVWRLEEMTFGTRVRLNDAREVEAFLRHAAARRRPPGNEASAVRSIRTINTAQVTYATTYPEIGFTCSLSDLGGEGPNQESSPRGAMLIDGGLASGRKSGYIFAVSGCAGSPTGTYQVTAVPEVFGQTGTRAFCSDDSGVIRFSVDGKAESCLTLGKPLQ